MSDFLGRFAFRHLSIGDQQFALNNKSILRKKLGEIGQNMILLSGAPEIQLHGTDTIQ